MAIRSTVHKADLSIADMDRHHYADHSLTLARHPSETEERLMVRLVAFAMHADERLTPAGGISTEDEPDFWHLDDTGSIRLWLQVGLPDERLLRRAAGRADEVIVLAYGGRTVDIWWQKDQATLSRLQNLRVLALSSEDSKAMAALAERNMDLGCTIQDGLIWLSAGETTLSIQPRVIHAPD